MKLNKIILLYAGLLFSSLALAQNFVCGVDLNNNGDITEQGETASCQLLGGEQFCSIGALNCNSQYKCNTNNSIFDTYDSCKNSCNDSYEYRDVKILKPFKHSSYKQLRCNTWVYVENKDNGFSGNFIIMSRYGGCAGIYVEKINIKYYGSYYKKGSFIRKFTHNVYPNTKYTEYSLIEVEKATINGVCSSSGSYSCPVSGNSCIDNNGIMQCSPNKCIDLDIDAPVETENPPTMQLDDGTRDANGACMDKSSLFSGRNLSCRKSGVSTAFKNCCKGFDSIIYDNTGSSSIVQTANVVRGIYGVVNAGYSAYSQGKDVVDAMSSYIEGGITGIDPYSIALNLAISFAIEYLLQGCNQQDMEVGMLNSSGYCTEVGEYCQKEWKFFGCVQKAKSYCCFNSKMARIIQEQGRPQLGMNWGSSESPNCAGFTPQQFQRLDFSKIDLSEYYNDIQAKADSLIQKNITDSVNEYYKKIGFDYAK
jgi:conjugal transfer mating pair stabilization protein TraN